MDGRGDRRGRRVLRVRRQPRVRVEMGALLRVREMELLIKRNPDDQCLPILRKKRSEKRCTKKVTRHFSWRQAVTRHSPDGLIEAVGHLAALKIGVTLAKRSEEI